MFSASLILPEAASYNKAAHLTGTKCEDFSCRK